MSAVATEIPVQALFEGDFLSFLVVFDSTDTIPEACDKVAFGVVGRRFAPREGGYVMRDEDGNVFSDDLTVEQAGIRPSDYVVVAFSE